MPVDSGEVATLHPTARSRVSNGSRILEGIDGRSREARRFRDVLAEIVSDLGGPDRLSEGQRQIARRCAMLAVECEKLEAIGVSGGEIDLECYGQLTDRMGRAFQRLGLKRVPKPVPLVEHLANLRERTPPPAAPDIEAEEATADDGEVQDEPP
jgi:hypothetical protein